MGFGSIWHWVIVLLVVVLLFGAGKIPQAAGDVAKAIKSFKKGIRDDTDTAKVEAIETTPAEDRREKV